METKYKKILPADVYLSIFDNEPTEAELWTGRIANEYGNRNSGSKFIDIFAGIIRKYGHVPISRYEKLMGLSSGELSGAMPALTGMTARSWRDEFLRMAACELLEKTDWKVTEISHRLGFTSIYVFSRFFHHVQKFQPLEWRYYKKTGKRCRYHYD